MADARFLSFRLLRVSFFWSFRPRSFSSLSLARFLLAFPVAFLFALPCLRPSTKDPSLPFSFLRRAVRCPLSCRNQLDCIV